MHWVVEWAGCVLVNWPNCSGVLGIRCKYVHCTLYSALGGEMGWLCVSKLAKLQWCAWNKVQVCTLYIVQCIRRGNGLVVC